MAKPVVWITRGLPGSGKTTWSKLVQSQYPDTLVVCKDDLRAMLNDSKFSKSNERLVLKIRDDIIVSAVAAHRPIIVCDTNLDDKHLEHIRQLVGGSATIEIKDFTAIPVDECIARDLVRANSVGEQVIRKMYNRYLAPELPKRQLDPRLRNAIICDLDGTLALLNGRDPYDASTCEQDKINSPIYRVVAGMMADGHVLIVTSGRSEEHREQTERWLTSVALTDYEMLLMRPVGDTRKDATVKEEMFRQHIDGKYNVVCVFDDRDSVVRLWRSLGLTCLQVAEGAF